MGMIDRQAAVEVADAIWTVTGDKNVAKVWQQLKDSPSVQSKRKKGKWIDAEQKVNITIFDEQTDDRKIETMTIEEILDTYTDEGCPEGWSDFECDWIPCSDRLPEKEGCYLITVDEYDRKDVNADFFYFREDGTPSWHYEKNVIAWMPFPEPYRGE